MVCDTLGLGGALAGADDEVRTDEQYLLVSRDGDYRIEVTTDAEEELFVQVQVFVDPEPVIVDPEEFTAHGWSGTLTGVGDTVMLRVPTGEWTAEGLDVACFVDGYGAHDLDQGGVFPLGAVCKHGAELSLGPYPGVVPFVLFNRTSEPRTVRITPR